MSESVTARVDESGNVFVTDGGGERLIGQYPDVPAETALAFFERKYADTNASLVLLEQRSKNGAKAQEILAGLDKLIPAIDAKAGIGNYDALTARVGILRGSLAELSESEKEKAAEEVEAARKERIALVEKIETLAQTDPSKLQWKTVSTQINQLFEQWQSQQKSARRLPKADSNDLWKRFSAARHKLEAERRTYFSQLDSQNKESKSVKENLIKQAESLASKDGNHISEYRALLEKWKQAPRAGKKVEEALWASFKAAGDKIFAAKAELDAKDDVEFSGNLEVKLALLTEAEQLLNATDRIQARQTLSSIQKRWDAAGKVPREQVKPTEERLRKVEAAVRKLEDEHWSQTDPEKQARTSGLASQIEQKIAKLDAELAEASAAGNTKKVAELTEALTTQREWLAVIS